MLSKDAKIGLPVFINFMVRGVSLPEGVITGIESDTINSIRVKFSNVFDNDGKTPLESWFREYGVNPIPERLTKTEIGKLAGGLLHYIQLNRSEGRLDSDPEMQRLFDLKAKLDAIWHYTPEQ